MCRVRTRLDCGEFQYFSIVLPSHIIYVVVYKRVECCKNYCLASAPLAMRCLTQPHSRHPPLLQNRTNRRLCSRSHLTLMRLSYETSQRQSEQQAQAWLTALSSQTRLSRDPRVSTIVCFCSSSISLHLASNSLQPTSPNKEDSLALPSALSPCMSFVHCGLSSRPLSR